jgi:peroxiredoxin family protein
MPTPKGIFAVASPLAILLISGDHERAHYAFVLASAASALGRRVTVFATNGGVYALASDWSGLANAGRDAVIRRAGVAGLGELRDAAITFSAQLIACESGLRVAGVNPSALLPDVEIGGVARFFELAEGAETITL